MKRSQKITGGFLFPKIDDLASIKGDDKVRLVRILPAPKPCAATKLQSIFKFEENFQHRTVNLLMSNQVYIFILSISCKIKLVFFKICNVNIKNAEELALC